MNDRDNIRRRMIEGLKLNNSKLTLERNDLIAKMQLMSHELAYFQTRCAELEEQNQQLQDKLDNVTLWDLSPEAQEKAGHALARELLGKPMTKEELAIMESEDCYVPYTGDDF